MGIEVIERERVPTWEEILLKVIETGQPIRIQVDKYQGAYRPRKKLEKIHGIEFSFNKVDDDFYEVSIKS